MGYTLKDAMEQASEKIRAEESVKKNASKYAELKNRIEQIYNEAKPEKKPDADKPVLPDFDPEYKTYDAPTDDELSELAKSGMAESYLTGKQNIASNAAKKTGNYNESKKKTEEVYADAAAEAQKYFEEAKQSSSDSVLKRGLARSSIAQLSQDELSRAQAETQTKLYADRSGKLADLDAAIAAADSERESALADYDLKHAAKLTQELDKLKSERAKKQESVLEYNNALAQKLEELAMKRADWETKYEAASEREYEAAVEAAAKKRDESVYSEVSAYLGALGADGAKKELRDNPYFKEILSSRDYSRLYDTYNK